MLFIIALTTPEVTGSIELCVMTEIAMVTQSSLRFNVSALLHDLNVFFFS